MRCRRIAPLYPAPVRTPALLLTVVVALTTLIAGCPSEKPSSDAAPDASAAQAAPAPSPLPSPTPASERRGVPVPAFDGAALDGSPLSISKFLGKRTLLWGFNPEVPGSRTIAAALAAIAPERTAANFQIAGFSQGSSVETTTAFLADAGLDFATFLDGGGAFATKVYRQARPMWAILMDADGNMIAETSYFPTDVPDPAKLIEQNFREWLRLTLPGELPLAPDFTAQQFDGEGEFKLSSLRGTPVILMFFLYTCPHCHEALKTLRAELPKLSGGKRPKLIGVSTYGSELSVREELKSQGIDIFDVILRDDDIALRNRYGALQGVPVILLIDAQGRITGRTQGWRNDRDPPLMRMRVAKLAGVTPPMLLSQSGYSGNDFCAACHASEAATFQLTQHATAMTTLAKHGADGRSECVTCHVVGYGKSGGYAIAKPEPALENVGCETCHGRGGPHLSPSHVASENYEPVCATCHTPEHSLGFKYAAFLPRVSHASLAKLTPAEKQAFLAARGKPRNDLLPENVAKVGSEACASCHAQEFAKWKAHPHAEHSPEIGCESCHGGGADHVAAGAQRKGTILSLADKCGSCAITQLCGSCHSEEREPGFQFHIREKIEHQRHSDEPLQGLVSNEPPKASVAAALAGAFAAPAGR
jgi:peroxiredoxin